MLVTSSCQLIRRQHASRLTPLEIGTSHLQSRSTLRNIVKDMRMHVPQTRDQEPPGTIDSLRVERDFNFLANFYDPLAGDDDSHIRLGRIACHGDDGYINNKDRS